jgi:hypothetical protein
MFETRLFARRGPVFLRGALPGGAEWLHAQPRLGEFAVLDPVGLHAGPAACFPCRRVLPDEGEPEPCPVAAERVVVHDDPDAGAFLSRLL